MFKNHGQILVEALVGLALVVIGIASAIVLFFSNTGVTRERNERIEARALAKEGLEAAEQIIKENWSAASDGPHGLSYTNGVWSFSGTEDINGIFTRSVTLTSSSSNKKEVTARVSWQTNSGENLEVTLTTLVSDWENALAASAGYCDTLSGNWTSPILIGSIDDLGAGRQATDVLVRNNILYISSTASSKSIDDFSIYNVSTPSAPQLLGSIDTGGGINEMALNGDYIFAVSNDDDKEFIVIDVSNPQAPTEAASLNLGGSGNANSVAYGNDHVFIGRRYSRYYPELEVINVENPTSPVVVSSVNLSTSVYKVYTHENKLYYTYYRLEADVGVRDISNLPATTFLGSWDIEGNSGVGADDVASIFIIDEQNMFFGGDWAHSFFYGDGSDPGTFLFPYYSFISNVGGIVRDLVVADGFAFLATDDSNKEFQIINVSNPNNIFIQTWLNMPQIATGIACENNKIYLSMRSNDALRIITSSP